MVELFATGAAVSAQRALKMGIVSKLFPDTAALSAHLEAFREEFLGAAPGAVTYVKRMPDDMRPLAPLSDQRAIAMRHLRERRISEEAAEGLAALREKREPCWKGAEG